MLIYIGVTYFTVSTLQTCRVHTYATHCQHKLIQKIPLYSIFKVADSNLYICKNYLIYKFKTQIFGKITKCKFESAVYEYIREFLRVYANSAPCIFYSRHVVYHPANCAKSKIGARCVCDDLCAVLPRQTFYKSSPPWLQFPHHRAHPEEKKCFQWKQIHFLEKHFFVSSIQVLLL